MIPYKYGEFKETQVKAAKQKLRKQIFFLLLYVDPETAGDFNVDVEQAFINVQTLMAGLNAILLYPREVVLASSMVESALMEYKNPDFSYKRYRKLILDAGTEVEKIQEEVK